MEKTLGDLGQRHLTSVLSWKDHLFYVLESEEEESKEGLRWDIGDVQMLLSKKKD